ncbi:hypothetical protein HPB51_003966 [Rhipicephalus microplus]|uniref:Ionotropic glutamate receptor C-terminal domain-containing protein n=1 Tax=Rhipicephalus microplus TaxID=6941 RepID=A0A9J6DT20_RHIMP|nr:hypothetical protein HPB51_003966 [Rhipicephalus microplus]
MKPLLGVSVVNGEVAFDGLAWYIVQTLQRYLQFNVQLQTTDEQIWSSRRPTGEWGGPLGMLERNESDISVHPVIPTADRLTDPLVDGALHAEKQYVSMIPRFCRQWCTGLSASNQPAEFRSADCFVCRTMRPVRNALSRVLFAVWWLAVVVLMNSFQGNMKASMSVKTPTERLETFRDVADRPHIKPIIIRGTTFEHQFQVSPEPELRKILSRARRQQSILPASVVFTRQTFDEMIAERSIIFMEDNVMQNYIAALYPQKPGLGLIYPSKQHTISAQFCMLMRNSLEPRVMKLFHARCRWLHESGLIERKRLQLQSRSWYLMRPPSSQVHSLSFEDTAALFYMVMLGQAVALLVFLAELFFRRFVFAPNP